MTTTIDSDAAARGHAARQGDLALRVDTADMVADGVRRLVLRDPDGIRLPDWTPGSHIDVVLPGQLVRQYSLCGDRWDAYSYQVAVLREPAGRGGSAYVHDELRVGDSLGIGGPRNNFAMAPAPNYVFVAGGIGITPLLPMIAQAQLLAAGWSLWYGGRSRASMAFLPELSALGSRVTVWPQDRKGLLPLADVFAGLSSPTKVYCCGPAPLLSAVEHLGAGLPSGSLRTERFEAAPLAAPVRSTSFVVRLRRSGVSATVSPGDSILEAVAKSNVPVLSSCRRGLCGTCETTVLDGIPDHRDSLLTDEERARGDVMMPCVSRSCSDTLVLDL